MHNVMEVDNMDEPVKKKYNIVFAVLLLIMLSAVYIWLLSVYFLDYINRSDIIKVHFSQFFILFVPLFLYFSFAGTLVFLNKEMVLKKHKFFKVLFFVFLSLAVFSFAFLIIGSAYMDKELISEGYIKCPKASFRSSTIYVTDAELCNLPLADIHQNKQ
ncbi:DUF1240 domain-containing protein [Morganella morganii]|uniref:DUF1240 domain-containing protein n=1 Tax=Morganella morganii TaxID=582 RepID=UPI002024CF72|nr:DUF1240 domain-containing protein [Morganella morganii]